MIETAPKGKKERGRLSVGEFEALCHALNELYPDPH